MKPANSKRACRSGLIGLCLLASGLAACGQPSAAQSPATDATTSTVATYAGKQVVWVDSYHAEYEWSIALESGLRSVFEDSGVEFAVLRMDTKNISDADERAAIAANMSAEIEQLQPDVVIATDDNAQKYLVVPHLADTDLPVVFAGVNWDASPYGYPTDTITGMVEVDLVTELVDLLSPYAAGEAIGYLSGDTSTDHKVADAYNNRFFDGEMEARFVTSFDEFKVAFDELQESVDILFVGNNAGIDGWDDVAAEAWIGDATRIPTGSRQSWMAAYVLISLARLGTEQGEWAAGAALRILDGTAPGDIPVAENERGELLVNLTLADALGLALPPSVLRNATIYPDAGS